MGPIRALIQAIYDDEIAKIPLSNGRTLGQLMDESMLHPVLHTLNEADRELYTFGRTIALEKALMALADHLDRAS